MEYAQYIDHTFLKPEARKKNIDKLIEEAIKFNFKTICIHGSWTRYTKEKLINSNVGITNVIGFPFGASSTAAKVYETKKCIEDGADEIDMVINIGRLKDGQVEYVLNEIKKIKSTCGQKILKVTIETSLLTNDEKKIVTKIILNSGADFIKTSTGFSYYDAKVEDIKLIKEIVGDKMKIKAEGGIKSIDDLNEMIKFGANRIGTSNAATLLQNNDTKDGNS